MDWWRKKETWDKLEDFHSEYARQPNLANIRKFHEETTTRIRNQLQADKQCKRLEYTGSAYEGVQIGPDIEFDVMFILDGTDLEIEKTPSAEHFFLKAKAGFFYGVDKRYEQFIESSKRRELIPHKVRRVFRGILQTTLNKLYLDTKITLQDHGPAVQMTVFSPHGVYRVDMVPCFEEGGGLLSRMLWDRRQFVAKPLSHDTYHPDHHLFWRQSFSMKENEFFRQLDRDNGCRKKIIRILKAFRLHDSSIGSLNSYHFKTALMELCRRDNSSWHWRQQNLVLRLMDMLGYLEECIQRKHMDHRFFGPKVNLLATLSERTLTTMYNRIRRMRACEHIFLSVISWVPRYHESEECPACRGADGNYNCIIL